MIPSKCMASDWPGQTASTCWHAISAWSACPACQCARARPRAWPMSKVIPTPLPRSGRGQGEGAACAPQYPHPTLSREGGRGDVLAAHDRPDAALSEQLQQTGMRGAAVEDDRASHTLAHRVDAALDLRDH